MSTADHRSRYLEQAAKTETIGPSPGRPAPSSERRIEELFEVAEHAEGREERLHALRQLATLSFASEPFQAVETRYVSLLRTLATDSDARVRRAALETLALRRDEYAQQLLLDSLEGRASRLVPERAALRFLGYDEHATPRDTLLRLERESSDQSVRKQALRLLSPDGASKDVFERVASDASEDPEMRRIGLVALQSVDPKAFGDAAKAVALDEAADEDLRAASLTALANEARAPRGDVDTGEIRQAVAEVKDATSSRRLARAAENFLDAHGTR